MNQKKAIRQLRELEKLSKKPRLAAEGWKQPWQCLIATALSARTKDETTIVVCNKLFKKYNLQQLAKAKFSAVAKIIKPVNFYKNKTKNIIACAKMLVKIGKVPVDISELVKLPGVGRKTANVFLAEMGEAAIGVDTHISHISQKLGWTKNKNPHKIEEDLKKLFPKNFWSKINYIIVGFGRTYQRGKKRDELIEKLIKHSLF
ncbi:endonuclease III [Candidatus Woesearchaeota archaeon CG10_big_fil_rev_8_21_14_0_10_30_7]|nr:MAG: endonuclease III [Candidatus Woesearchaeota archaeon CG10_big_fil_rev_8_21_14_0_10_30_7]